MSWTDWATTVGGLFSLVGAGLGLWAVRDARKTAKQLASIRNSLVPQLVLHYFGCPQRALLLRLRNTGIAPVKVNDVLLAARGVNGGIVFSRFDSQPGVAAFVRPDDTISCFVAPERSCPPSRLVAAEPGSLRLLAQIEGTMAREVRLTDSDRKLILCELSAYCSKQDDA